MKKLILFKNQKQNDNQPDFRLVAKGEEDELVEVAAFWKATDEQGNPKQDKNGNSFLTGKLKDPYQDKTGYKIVSDVSQEAGTFEQTGSTSGDIF